MGPNEKLEQGIVTVDPLMVESALNEGANPYERIQFGPNKGLSPLELLADHPQKDQFSPKMWTQVQRSFDMLPKTREDTLVLQSAILKSSYADSYATTLFSKGTSYIESNIHNTQALAHASGQMKVVAESSAAWSAFRSMVSFPSDFSQQIQQHRQNGQLDGELFILQHQPQPSFKPSFAVGKDNNHHEEIGRAPSVSNSTSLPLSEGPFNNTENLFNEASEGMNNGYDDDIGEYHHLLSPMNASKIKLHRQKTTRPSIDSPSGPNSSNINR